MKKTYKLLALLSMLNAGMTIAQTLNSPTVILPKANATDVAPVSAFIWSKVPTASLYQFKLFKADSSLVLDTLVTDTIFSPQTLSESMSYTWMVRAKSNLDSSAYFHSYFTTKAMDMPKTPSTIAPMGAVLVVTGGGTTSSTVAFSWTASALASKYHLQVSDDSLFNTLIINDTTSSDNYYKNSTLFNYNKKYFWRVAAKNSTGKSAFSKTIAFNIPVEINVRPAMVTFKSPTNGATNLSSITDIIWNKSKNATSYRFVLKDTLGNIVLQDDSLSSSDTMMVARNLEYGRYYIATVYARNQYGNSEPSFVYFTTESITTGPAKPSFNSKGSVGDAVYYNYDADAITKKVFVIWSDKRSFDTYLFVDSLSFPASTSTLYNPSNLTLNKWYYVKLIARNTFGFSSALVDSVYNTMPAPNNVYISSPIDTATSKLTPVISWTTSKWATSYKVSILSFEIKDTVYRSIHTDSSFVLPAGYLQAGKVYDLYVEAINSVGSAVTHRMIKTTGIPTPPAPVTKKDTVYMQNGSYPTLTWPAASGATSYCLQIARDSNFTQLMINDCNINETSYLLTSAKLSVSARMEAVDINRFYWRVAATNASGQGVWSTPSKFAVVIITANEENTINQTVSVFPNPVINMLTINAEVVSVNVKNTSGSIVMQSAINTLDMSNLAAGMYFVEFKTNAGTTQIVKVIKGE